MSAVVDGMKPGAKYDVKVKDGGEERTLEGVTFEGSTSQYALLRKEPKKGAQSKPEWWSHDAILDASPVGV